LSHVSGEAADVFGRVRIAQDFFAAFHLFGQGPAERDLLFDGARLWESGDNREAGGYG
jgi:hypothetical protein